MTVNSDPIILICVVGSFVILLLAALNVISLA